MQRSSRRLIALAAALAAFTIGAALLYQIGMLELEGKHRTFWDSIEWAAETLSTTGYGYDSHWKHPAMVLLVVFVQFVGVFLIFLVVPIFLVPFLEERFEERLPRAANDSLHDHVIVYRYGPAVETLLQRLRESGVPSLVAETDEGRRAQCSSEARASCSAGPTKTFSTRVVSRPRGQSSRMGATKRTPGSFFARGSSDSGKRFTRSSKSRRIACRWSSPAQQPRIRRDTSSPPRLPRTPAT